MRWPLTSVNKREVPHEVEQVGRREHASDQQLLPGQLSGGLAELGRQLVARQRRRVLPLQEVLRTGREGADPRLVAVGRDDELVGPEQLLVALGHAEIALVGVAAQLVDALGHRVGDVRALALDDDQRDAVDEQHDVRRDELLGLAAGLINPELVDRQEIVASRGGRSR